MGPIGSQEIYTKSRGGSRKVFSRRRRLLCNLSERIARQPIAKDPRSVMSSRTRRSAKEWPDLGCRGLDNFRKCTMGGDWNRPLRVRGCSPSSPEFRGVRASGRPSREGARRALARTAAIPGRSPRRRRSAKRALAYADVQAHPRAPRLLPCPDAYGVGRHVQLTLRGLARRAPWAHGRARGQSLGQPRRCGREGPRLRRGPALARGTGRALGRDVPPIG